MSVRKVQRNNEVRWEVYVLTQGRGSKRLRRRFGTRVQAEAFLEAFKQRRRELKRLGGLQTRDLDDTTFGEEAQYWVERQGMRFSPGHLRRVKGILKEILPELRKLKPSGLNPERLTRFQSEQLRLGLTPATVNRKTDVITAALNFSVRHRRLPFTPAAGFRKLAEVREEMKFWERNEAESFLEFANQKYPSGHKDRWIYVVYLLALNTALRAGEIWGLQARDLVQEGDLIHVRRQWDLNVMGFRLPKGKKTRLVPCNEVLRNELEAIRPSQDDQTFFQKAGGGPVLRDTFDRWVFRPDLKESGLKPIRFHDLRHSATTLMIAEGLDLKTVQEICGHKEIMTTMRYVHLLGDAVKRAGKVFSVRPSPKTPDQPPRQPALRLVATS
jgi:integrase